ncbi:MAG: sigma-54-dependent Fis family transcriptional regulator, partial [Planctomycetes bacterium]|nr:sigma-54-dependent Fis family transcriptional regulator [Planctomycetota bacterium]
MSLEQERILVVDDSSSTLEVLERNLRGAGYQVYSAGGVVEAIEVLENTLIDLVITDIKMPKIGGMDLVRHVRENYKDTEVMVITGYASIEGAVDAVKCGAEEYLPKPFTDEELSAAVKRAFSKLKARRWDHHLELGGGMSGPSGLLGQSVPMHEVYRFIEKAASASATVLVTGESGTGKELVARAIHYGSERASAPFIPVNCGGIPESLLESELFGHVKGAFTGAVESRAGFFHAADGGTLFLDEIGEMSLSMQVKLLRVLQDKQVCMVGSERFREVNVRIIAATNKVLSEQVAKQVFREDLYYRLNVISISLPPLSERGDDILLLAQHFADKYAREMNRRAVRFSEEARQVLRGYNWPGNVRELENVIQRMLVMTDGEVIEAPDLPSLMRFSALRGKGYDRTLSEVEAEYISQVMDHVGGNKSQAARVLGIDRKTLHE